MRQSKTVTRFFILIQHYETDQTNTIIDTNTMSSTTTYRGSENPKEWAERTLLYPPLAAFEGHRNPHNYFDVIIAWINEDGNFQAISKGV